MHRAVNRRRHQRARHAEVECQLAHPFSGALRAGRIADQIDEILAGLFVFHAENVSRDLNEVAIEISSIPLGENVVQFVVRQAECVLEHPIRFADELHVAVLDAVVNHFHIVARTASTDPLATRDIVVRSDLGRDGLEDVLTPAATPFHFRRA